MGCDTDKKYRSTQRNSVNVNLPIWIHYVSEDIIWPLSVLCECVGQEERSQRHCSWSDPWHLRGCHHPTLAYLRKLCEFSDLLLNTVHINWRKFKEYEYVISITRQHVLSQCTYLLSSSSNGFVYPVCIHRAQLTYWLSTIFWQSTWVHRVNTFMDITSMSSLYSFDCGQYWLLDQTTCKSE